MPSQQPQIRRTPSDGSATESTRQKKDDSLACRHIETLFPTAVHDENIKSVYGENFFLPAQIIYEGRSGCADKPVRKWSIPRRDTPE